MSANVDFKVSQIGAYVPPSTQAVLGGPQGTTPLSNNGNTAQTQQLQASAGPNLVLMQQMAQQNMRWELPDGVYQGQIKDGRPHGRGIMTYRLTNDKKYQMYEGEFVEGQMHGKGVMVWQNGDRYNGTFINNSVTGFGVKENHDGGVYEGNLVNGKREGQGKFTGKSGNKYVGSYKDDKRHGAGEATWDSGSYKGNFDNGEYHGYGEYIDKVIITDTYKGNWANGKYHGQGELRRKYTSGTEEVITGIFNNGELWEGKKGGQTYKEGKPYNSCVIL